MALLATEETKKSQKWNESNGFRKNAQPTSQQEV